jgi:hypothetical protein
MAVRRQPGVDTGIDLPVHLGQEGFDNRVLVLRRELAVGFRGGPYFVRRHR